jgi:hypothetical protein
VTCDRSVVFSGSSGFLHQYNWQPRYNWNIIESAVKPHKTKPNQSISVPDVSVFCDNGLIIYYYPSSCISCDQILCICKYINEDS